MLKYIRKLLSNERGSYGVLVSIICAMVISTIISPSLYGGIVAMSRAQSDDTIYAITSSYGKTKYAQLERASYASVVPESRALLTVSGTNYQFEREVLVTETDLGGGLKQKDITINMYNSGDMTPVFTLPLTLSSQGSGSSGVPVGTVIIWASPTLPTNGTWLECNGQSTVGYPELAAIVGANVPDYRGYFLRGFGGNSAGIGVIQNDAIRNITGSLGLDDRIVNEAIEGAFYFSGGTSSTGSAGTGVGARIHFDASRVVSVANENRPMNKSVLYLIKAKSVLNNI